MIWKAARYRSKYGTLLLSLITTLVLFPCWSFLHKKTNQKLSFFLPSQRKTISKQNLVLIRMTSAKKKSPQAYSIEFNPNFHVYVVQAPSLSTREEGGTNIIQESFQFRNEAVQKYPTADHIPSQYYSIHNLTTLSDIHTLLEMYLHPNQTSSSWSYAQTQQMVHERVPHLLKIPRNVLEERLQFFLQPRPQNLGKNNNNNTTDYCDWPLLVSQGYGLGIPPLELGQAFSTLPESLWSYAPFCMPNTLVETRQTPALLGFLYTNTPSIVLDMALQQMNSVLTGTSQFTIASFAYLHWTGWEWDRIEHLVCALPSTLNFAEEPSWELLPDRRKKGFTPPKEFLNQDGLWYLRTHLQIKPKDLLAMMRIHPQMTRYKMERFQSSVQTLETILTTRQVRDILLNMPSLLGASDTSIQDHIHFWTNSVGLSSDQVRHVISRFPALLQYSLDRNLIPKYKFFIHDLSLTQDDLTGMTVRKPQIWGRSLTHCLETMWKGFTIECENCLTPQQFGQLVSTAPELLLYNWKGNIRPKIRYIRDAFQLSSPELSKVLLKAPRILAQSLCPSIQNKTETIVNSLSVGGGRYLIVEKPGLLLLSNEKVKLQILQLEGSSADKPLVRNTVVLCIEPGSGKILNEFPNVAQAALYASRSTSRMYGILKSRALVDGKMYLRSCDYELRFPQKQDTGKHSRVSDSETAPQISTNVQNLLNLEEEGRRTLECLTIYCTGRAYPPETHGRGHRRSGGMALEFNSISKWEWKSLCATLWKGKRYRVFPSSSSVMLEYSYVRPSRHRCSMVSRRTLCLGCSQTYS